MIRSMQTHLKPLPVSRAMAWGRSAWVKAYDGRAREALEEFGRELSVKPRSVRPAR
jgi:hypothetical protein